MKRFQHSSGPSDFQAIGPSTIILSFIGRFAVFSKNLQDSPVALLDSIALCLLDQRLAACVFDLTRVAQKRLSVIFPPNMLGYNAQRFQEANGD